jgi:hypothetical protein
MNIFQRHSLTGPESIDVAASNSRSVAPRLSPPSSYDNAKGSAPLPRWAFSSSLRSPLTAECNRVSRNVVGSRLGATHVRRNIRSSQREFFACDRSSDFALVRPSMYSLPLIDEGD